MSYPIRRGGIAAFLSICAYAQVANQTALVGIVTDATGKAVVTSAVSALNTGTGDVYNTTTSETGVYSIQSIRTGVYDITVKEPGFRTFRATRVQVDTNQVVRTDVIMM